MNLKQTIAAVLHLFILLGMVASTLFFFLLDRFSDVRIFLADALLHQPELFTRVGFALLALSALLFWGFFGLNRGYYLVLNMGKNTFAIDEKVLWRTIDPFLRKRFQDRLILNQVEMGNGKHLFFGMQAAQLNEEESEQLLQEAENELEILLRERFGYRRTFTVRLNQ